MKKEAVYNLIRLANTHEGHKSLLMPLIQRCVFKIAWAESEEEELQKEAKNRKKKKRKPRPKPQPKKKKKKKKKKEAPVEGITSPASPEEAEETPISTSPTPKSKTPDASLTEKEKKEKKEVGQRKVKKDQEKKKRETQEAQEKEKVRRQEEEAKRKKEEEEAAKQKKQQESSLDVESFMEGLSSTMGGNLGDSFQTYHADRGDFKSFLEQAGSKIHVPYLRDFPLSGLIRGLTSFWTSGEYSPTVENFTRISQGLTNYANSVFQTFGLVLIKNVVWDLPKLALKSMTSVIKAPLNLMKFLIKDTATADWMVEKGVISYDYEIEDGFIDDSSDNIWQTLSEFTRDNLKKTQSTQELTWAAKFKRDTLQLANFAGRIFSFNLFKPFQNTLEKIDQEQEASKEGTLAGELIENYFGSYMQSNATDKRRNMRGLVKKYLSDNKGDVATQIQRTLQKLLDGKEVTLEDLKKDMAMTPDNVQLVIEQSVLQQAQTLAEKVKGMDDEAKSIFRESLKNASFTERIEAISDEVSREVHPEVKTDVRGMSQGKYELGNLGPTGVISHAAFDAMIKEEGAKGQAARKSKSLRSTKGPARLLLDAWEDIKSGFRSLRDIKVRPDEKDKGVSFKDWVKQRDQSGGFYNPKTKNKVQFGSLPEDEQKAIRKKFKGKKSSSLIKIAHQNPHLRDRILPMLEWYFEKS